MKHLVSCKLIKLILVLLDEKELVRLSQVKKFWRKCIEEIMLSDDFGILRVPIYEPPLLKFLNALKFILALCHSDTR